MGRSRQWEIEIILARDQSCGVIPKTEKKMV